MPGFTTLFSRALDIYRNEGAVELLDDGIEYLYENLPVQPDLLYRRYTTRVKHGVSTYPQRIYWVDPGRITHSGPHFSREKDIGTVRSGDWDQDCSLFTDSTVYQGLRERFIEGKNWTETTYYQSRKEKFEHDETVYEYSSPEEFLEGRCTYLDQLYVNIKQNGYRTQAELNGTGRDSTRHKTTTVRQQRTHEIGCNVSRDGELLVNSGNHRLSIAKIQGIDRIPVNIIVRHAQWQEKRAAIKRSVNPVHTASASNVDLDHPDIRYLI